MHYNLIISQRAEEMLDEIVNYLIQHLKSRQAALRLLKDLEQVYCRLKENPYQFPICKEDYLTKKEYRVVPLKNINYILIFKVLNDTVCVLGIFHQLEQYNKKL